MRSKLKKSLKNKKRRMLTASPSQVIPQKQCIIFKSLDEKLADELRNLINNL